MKRFGNAVPAILYEEILLGEEGKGFHDKSIEDPAVSHGCYGLYCALAWSVRVQTAGVVGDGTPESCTELRSKPR